MTNRKKSLLDVPAEVRVKIIHSVFEDGRDIVLSTKFIDPKDDKTPVVCVPKKGAEICVDAAITLTCRLLRSEAMPILLQHLNLIYHIDNRLCPATALCIKQIYLRNIRSATLIYNTLWVFDFSALPSLRSLRLECGEIIEGLPDALDMDMIEKAVENSDVETVIEQFKTAVGDYLRGSDEAMGPMLDNRDRGFSVAVVERLTVVDDDNDDLPDEDMVCRFFILITQLANLRQTMGIDWDTSAPLCGTQALLEKFRSILDNRNDARNSSATEQDDD